ncbi:putative protein N(5)-glutamine methyltransferase [Streptomyces sp. NPDC052396]|uniref:putative protein N(5)-glutamine methyltransferase n=1 Tax=Streptomyces sp. NPDC052396 TaxID=3365689 RepID=UPI0037CD0FC1
MSLSSIITQLRTAGCVFAEDEAELLASAAGSPAELAALADRRAAGFPLEQVLGWAEFGGRRIAVDPGVFVPRRRTEFLVEQAAGLLAPGAVLLDLCCGTGALGAALAAGRTDLELYAADIDPAAVRCARRNLAPLGGRVYQGDLFGPLPGTLRGRVDVLLANVPYVPTADIAFLPAEARDHEARVALDGGADGLDVLRRVAAGAPHWLAPGGRLLFETSRRQRETAITVITSAGLTATVATCEDRDATVVLARWAPAS